MLGRAEQRGEARRRVGRGVQNQSIEPSSATRTAVCVAEQGVLLDARRHRGSGALGLGALARFGALADLHERDAQLRQRAPQRLRGFPETVTEPLDERRHPPMARPASSRRTGWPSSGVRCRTASCHSPIAWLAIRSATGVWVSSARTRFSSASI